MSHQQICPKCGRVMSEGEIDKNAGGSAKWKGSLVTTATSGNKIMICEGCGYARIP